MGSLKIVFLIHLFFYIILLFTVKTFKLAVAETNFVEMSGFPIISGT